MHPLGYLLDLRRSRTPYVPQALGLMALFSVPCVALSLASPDAGVRFLIIAAVGMVFALPIYQARSHLSLLSSLRRSHCLEELLGCGMPAQGCADQLTRHALAELTRLVLPVVAVLIPGALLAGPEMRSYLFGLVLWLPVMLYLTALGSYAAFVQMAWAGGWRQKGRLAARCWPLLLPPVFLVVSNGGPLATLVTLALALYLARSLASQTLDRTVREEEPRPAGAKWRNRWVTSWSENPIVVRESWRRSSVPGGLLGYVVLRFVSVALPLWWITTVVDQRTRGVFWGGAFLLALFYAARAGQRTLGAVVGEREQATWDTLCQTGLALRTFIIGWVQVGSFPVLLEAIVPGVFGLGLAWAFPAAVTPESWSRQASSFENKLLVAVGFAAGVVLVMTAALAGLALSASSRTLRQATGRAFGVVATTGVCWLLAWGLGTAVLGVLGNRGWIQADLHWWETVVQVLLPLAALVGLCAWRARVSWRSIHAHLSLEEWPEPRASRWGLVPAGGFIFLAVGLWATRRLPEAFALGLVGLAAGWLMEWWWAPLLKAWRGSPRVVALTSGLSAALAGLAFTPLLVRWSLAWPHQNSWRSPQLWDNPTGALLTALPLAALLGALCASPDRELEPEPGGDLGRRTLVVAVIALLLSPYVEKLL